MMVATYDVHEHLGCVNRWCVFFSMGTTVAPSIGMPVIRIVQLADGEELVTVECDQCSGHVTDDPRDELLKHRHTAEVSTCLCGQVARRSGLRQVALDESGVAR